jgi:hypothetical protein
MRELNGKKSGYQKYQKDDLVRMLNDEAKPVFGPDSFGQVRHNRNRYVKRSKISEAKCNHFRPADFQRAVNGVMASRYRGSTGIIHLS